MVSDWVKVAEADRAEGCQLIVGAHDDFVDGADVGDEVPALIVEEEGLQLSLLLFFFRDLGWPPVRICKDSVAVDVPVLADKEGNEKRLERNQSQLDATC